MNNYGYNQVFCITPEHLSNVLLYFQVQFVGIMVHAFQLLFIDCNYPKAFVWWIGMHAVMFFFLFKEFYNQSYSRRRPKAKVEANGHANAESNGEIKHNESKQNGIHSKNGISNGLQNGYSKQNGASQYYVNSQFSSELHHRAPVVQ